LPEDVEHAGFVEHLAVLLGGEEAGDQRVDADVLVRPLAGEVAGEVVDGGLGERVGEDAREGIESEDGAKTLIEGPCLDTPGAFSISKALWMLPGLLLLLR
jgi:hypothetical protein